MRRLGFASFCVAAVALSSTASAHVRFTSPIPRYPTPTGAFDNGMNIKEGPCGKANDMRTTDEARINEFQAGETITVEFNETIDHPGFFRISFDDDGQDAFEPPPLSRDDIVSAPTSVILKDNIEDKDGGSYSVDVTLPNVNCDHCTLQLIQVMVDDDTWPRSEIYYTCADLTLTGATNGTGGMGGTGAGGVANGGAGAGGMSAGSGGVLAGAGGVSGSPSAGGASAGGRSSGGGAGLPIPGGAGGAPSTGGAPAGGSTSATGGTAPVGTGGTASGTAGRSGSGGAPGAAGSPGGTPTTPPDEEEGGCSIGTARSRNTGVAALAAACAALITFGARRKRR